MRNVKVVWFGTLIATALLGLTACSSSSTSDGGGDDGELDSLPAPEFPEGSGQAPNGAAAYPPGPYGVSKGSIISNLEFVGYFNPMDKSRGMQLVTLADFYNPTGADVFPENTPYPELAGTPKPKALLIMVSASWCGPCQQEAAEVVPGKYEKYHPMGGEFLLQLVEGPNYDPAVPKNLDSWTNKFDVNYPAAIDPSYKMGAFVPGAFPANMIINTRTMEIVQVVTAAPSATFWTKFESLLQ